MLSVTQPYVAAPEVGLPMKGRLHGSDVGPQARREYLGRMREPYETATRAAKSRLLDEVKPFLRSDIPCFATERRYLPSFRWTLSRYPRLSVNRVPSRRMTM
jgi:hypothetical protein